MRKYNIDDLYVNQYYEKNFCVTEEVGAQFAEISKDFNPIHLDEETAGKSRFGRKIVHGMLIGSYFSGIIGSEFPGTGSIYISQSFRFKRPVYYNENITIRVEVAAVDRVKTRVTLKTQCIDSQGEILVDGVAEILFEN